MYKDNINKVQNKFSITIEAIDNDGTIASLQEYDQMKKAVTQYKRYESFGELLEEIRAEE